MTDYTFNVDEAPISLSVPEGVYAAHIVESELRDNAKGTGRFIELKFSILTPGDHQNVRINTYLNIEHQNARVSGMGLFQLRQLCKAMGLSGIKATEDLHHKPVDIKIVVRKATDDYGESNDIRDFLPLGQPIIGYAPPAPSNPHDRFAPVTPPPSRAPAVAPTSDAPSPVAQPTNAKTEPEKEGTPPWLQD